MLRNGILIKIKKLKNQAITKNDLILFENKNGNIPKHSSIILSTHLKTDHLVN